MKSQDINIICDTDACTDVDDFLALAYLAKEVPDELKLVSTTYGPVSKRAKAVGTLFHHMGYKVPVVIGEKKLLTDTKEVWLAGNEDYLIDSTEHLSELSIYDAYLNFENFTLLALGPLTNIAMLLQHRDFEKKCSRMVIMGGSLYPNGVIPKVEHNFESDPLATQAVMQSNIEKIIVPVDLTLQFPMTEEYQKLFQASDEDYVGLLSQWIKNWRKTTRPFAPPFHDSVHWHDPITAAYLSYPELFRSEEMLLEVEGDGSLTIGSGNKAKVCVGMDPKVIDIVARTILGPISNPTP
jgi:purine nucleosidase